MVKYFCLENGQTAGPFTLQELKNKGLKSIDLVFPTGGDRWIRVDSVKGWSEVQSEVQKEPLFNSLKLENTGKATVQSPMHLSKQKPKATLPEIENSNNPIAFESVDAISIDNDSIGGKQSQIDLTVEPPKPGIDAHSEKQHSCSHVEDDAALGATSQAMSKMGFWHAYALGWSRFKDFKGRSRRMEYWSWSLVNTIILMLFFALVGLSDGPYSVLGFWSLVLTLYFLACLIPGFALSIRRLHDIGFTGWWILISFVPYLSLLLIIFSFIDSQKGANKWGPNPKEP